MLFSEHKPEHHMQMRAFVINPIFARSGRYVLKECFRQLKRSCLYFRLGLTLTLTLTPNPNT